MRLLVLLLSIFLVASPVSAQEKKTARKAQKKAEPKQDWGHFDAGAKKDQKAMAKKKADKKADKKVEKTQP